MRTKEQGPTRNIQHSQRRFPTISRTITDKTHSTHLEEEVEAIKTEAQGAQQLTGRPRCPLATANHPVRIDQLENTA